MMSTISISDPIYQGEGKWFPFLIVDGEGNPINLATATFMFHIKQSVDDPVPLYAATQFDITEAGVGIIKANLPAAQTLLMAEGTYLAQLLTVITSDTDVDISDLVKFKIKKPVVEA
jgi:hypothetical protein